MLVRAYSINTGKWNCRRAVFFEQVRIWRLSLYDHAGTGMHFFYRVQGDAIALLADGNDSLGWSTEIPMAKLYAALELGESLTSMYMRINDAVFDAQTEQDIATADIVDDPLIRCLFNEVFGAYQSAQLHRLQARATALPIQQQ